MGAVSYLNTRPLVYGLEQGMMQADIDLSFDYPANVAKQLLKNEIDVGLVPVAVLPMLKEYHIISDYCIGADGPVASVCLFSDVPLQEVTEVLVDYQSRTSAALLKILLKEHWKMQPVLTAAEKDFEAKITGTTAGLVIGDRAFAQRNKSKYIYDLAEVWKQMTGLPFVFAVWASNKPVRTEFSNRFNEATSKGLHVLEDIAAGASNADYDLKKYYTENISYIFDAPKKQALKKFHELLAIL